jgi:hypothetical protein
VAHDAFTSADRRGATRLIAIGNLAGLAVYGTGFFALRGTELPADHLAFAVWLCAIPAVFLYVVFLALLRMRDAPDALNPFLGAETLGFRINQRVLSNSVEQLAIFVPLLLALATRVDAAHAYLLPLHVGMWTVARIVFWIGYRIAPNARAPGMAGTHLATLATIAWLVRFTVA